MSLVVPILLAIAGCLTIFFLLSAFLSPLIGNFSRNIERQRIMRLGNHILRANNFINEGLILKSLQELRSATSLDTFKEQESLAMLNQIFSQIVEVVEKITADNENQDGDEIELDELLRERIELLELKIRVQQSLNSLKLKREGQGKKLPNWTFSDFKNKEEEVQKELSRNAKEIISIYDALIKNISLTSNKNIVYH